MQLLYHTFEFSETVIEFMEIVKFGVRMWKHFNMTSLDKRQFYLSTLKNIY